MKIYTKTGDAGETSLFSGERVKKSDLLVEAYGALDECNSHIGAALAASPREPVASALRAMQSDIFRLGADFATALGKREIDRISPNEIAEIERAMDELTSSLPPLRAFVLPGGTPAASAIHLARSTARRAEREAIRASFERELNPDALIFLNRLSDYLFLLARKENQLAGHAEPEWVPGHR